MSTSSNHTSNTVCIPLTQNQTAIVCSVDADLLNMKWQASKNVYGRYYAIHSMWKHKIWMHRVILERILDRPLLRIEQVDHIDLDGLNNQRGNLRLATASQNTMNRRRQSNNTSGYKGVIWNKQVKKWQATIVIERRNIYLGWFDTREEAHKAYKEASKLYHGKFGRTE